MPRAALLATGPNAKPVGDERDPVIADIAQMLRARGWEVVEGVGGNPRCWDQSEKLIV